MVDILKGERRCLGSPLVTYEIAGAGSVSCNYMTDQPLSAYRKLIAHR